MQFWPLNFFLLENDLWLNRNIAMLMFENNPGFYFWNLILAIFDAFCFFAQFKNVTKQKEATKIYIEHCRLVYFN